MRLTETIERGAKDYPERIALIFHEREITYGTLAAEVQHIAAELARQGVTAGQCVGLLLPNCPAFIAGYYAVSALGAVVVPVNPTLKPAELAYIWHDGDVRLVLTIAPLAAAAHAALDSLPGARSLVTLDPMHPAAAREPGTGNGEQEAIQNAVPRPPMPDTLPEDCAVIIYTSGTTGHPKGAMLSHRNLLRNIEQIQARLHFTPEDRFLAVLPLFHSFAATVCMNLVLAIGASAVLLENFAPGRVIETIEKQRITVVPAVPAIFNAVLHFATGQAFDFSALRMFVSGGAPLPAATLQALEARFGVPVLEGDGPTECSPVTSVNPLDGPRKIGSVGPPLPGVRVAIFDEQDNVLPAGEIGEIVVQGDNVMLGYLNQPEATAEAMTGDWYHTGDLGRVDEDGYVFIMDRKKDMIITSGLNVYPREIEEVLAAHPAVRDSAVIGLPDAMRGEEVVAVVVLRPEANTTERELTLFCRESLANYKVPRRILFRATLPLGSTGKVVKRLLKKELELETPA